LNIVSSAGGFGAVTDAVIEGAGRQVVRQTVPPGYDIRLAMAGRPNPAGEPPTDFVTCAQRKLSEGCLAWVYLGHAQSTELARVETPSGRKAILAVDDVPYLRCAAQRPLAVLVACHAGAMDAPRDCLAEELLLAEEGPIAVIAASRVTMPYGNTVIGYELLRACFQDRPETLGDILRLAQQRTVSPSGGDERRASLDSLAHGLSPAPVDLPAERREHVLMYHLFGDPLLRLRQPETRLAQTPEASILAK
jgi:hypothetical protein